MIELFILNFMILAAIVTGVYFHFEKKHFKRLQDDDVKASLLLHEYYNVRHGNMSAEDKFKFTVNFDNQVDAYVMDRSEDHEYVGDNVKLLSDYKKMAQ